MAVVCPDLAITGGVRSVATFVKDVLDGSDRYEPTLISVATASTDRASTLIRQPSTWRDGARVVEETSRDLTFSHVGARAGELEWMRYRPRPALDATLKQVDLVHVVSGSPAWGLVTRSVAVPVLLHCATLAEWERGAPAGGPLLAPWRATMTRVTGRLDRQGLRRATTVLAQNRRLAAFAEDVSPGRVELLHPGTDTGVFQPAQEYAADGHLLAVGRLGEPRKDWATLFRAYAGARRRQADLPDLVVAGRGQLRNEDVRVLAETGIEEHCRIAADVTQAELVELYQGASMYLLTSLEEGFGLVVVEAMACGVPVIATRLFGTLETVDHGRNGILVDRDDDVVTTVESAIVDLWVDLAARLRIRTEALASAACFSTETLSEQLLDVYARHLVAGHG